MAPTQEDLDKIDADLVKTAAVKSTTFADQQTTFRDADDALKIRSFVSRQAGKSRNIRFATTDKGV